MKDPNNHEDWQPGDRLTLYTEKPFALETMAGTVYIQSGTYGRFVMTHNGWMAEETHRENLP